MGEHHDDRRAFVKKAAWIAPAIMTLKAVPTFASVGSTKDDEKDLKRAAQDAAKEAKKAAQDAAKEAKDAAKDRLDIS